MNENDKIDDAAQAIEDHQSMVEATTDRHIFAEMKMPKQPTVTDFTEIRESTTQAGKYAVCVYHDSGKYFVLTPWVSREDAEKLELSIHVVMIEYRTKMNAWEKQLCQTQP